MNVIFGSAVSPKDFLAVGPVSQESGNQNCIFDAVEHKGQPTENTVQILGVTCKHILLKELHTAVMILLTSP